MDSSPDDLKEIRRLLRDLTGRVYRIERAMGLESSPALQDPPARTEVADPLSVAASPLALDPQFPSVAGTPIYDSSPRLQKASEGTSSGGLESRIGSHGRSVTAIAIVALNALALIAFTREVGDHYTQQMLTVRPGAPAFNWADWGKYRSVEIAGDFTYSALWMVYGAMLMVIGFWRKSAFVRWQALILIAATTVKVFVYDTSRLDHIYRILSFIALGILLLTVSFAYQRDWLQLSGRKQSEPGLKDLAQS